MSVEGCPLSALAAGWEKANKHRAPIATMVHCTSCPHGEVWVDIEEESTDLRFHGTDEGKFQDCPPVSPPYEDEGE